MPGRPLPGLLLAAYALAWGSAALGLRALGFDDHPGQLERVHHVLERGFAPWAWAPGWWAGYPELQFYPPGVSWAAAGLHRATLGALSPAGAYHAIVWLAWLAPGVSVFALLARTLGSNWFALPGALMALTLDMDLASGVEGGVRTGMVAARLGWGLLPLLPLTLDRWLGEAHRPPWSAALLLAVIVVVHPAHAPVALAIIVAAARTGAGPPRQRWLGAGGVLGLAAALTAVWTIPLLWRAAHTRALAWGSFEPLSTLARHPLALVLLALALTSGTGATTPRDRLLFRAPWAAAAVVALDALVVFPLGIATLPPDRVADAAWLVVVIAAGHGLGRLLDRTGPRLGVPAPLVAAAAVAVLGLAAMPGRSLAVWPTGDRWPSLEAVETGRGLDRLWPSLAGLPDGRVLFVRSSVPLESGTHWWRAHSHATALAPSRAGRAIVNGTFTHPSPVAKFAYTGSARPGPITRLVERQDGHTLFGIPLAELDGGTLASVVDAFAVSAVVALDEDRRALGRLETSPGWEARPLPPFVLYTRPLERPAPRESAPGRWFVALDAGPGDWSATGLSYYPLWQGWHAGRALETRRGPLGELQVRRPPGVRAVELVYTPAFPEHAGLATSVAALLVIGALTYRARLFPQVAGAR